MFKTHSLSKIRSYSLILAFSVLTILPVLTKAQSAAKEASLTISGEVKTSINLTPAAVDKMEKVSIVSKDRNDKEYTYSGVELATALKAAGVSLGEELKGENLTKYLLIEASDGYQVLFSLPEVDPAFTQRKIILANRKDDVLMAADEGPFHIIIEGEMRKPRFIRQVTAIRIKYAE